MTGRCPHLSCDVHYVPNARGLCKGHTVQRAGQQVPTASYAAGCNVCTLLHPPHDLQCPTHGLASPLREPQRNGGIAHDLRCLWQSV